MLITPVGSKLEATFLDNGKELVAEVNGDFWGGSASIVLKDGTRLAHIARKPTAADAVVDKQTVSRN